MTRAAVVAVLRAALAWRHAQSGAELATRAVDLASAVDAFERPPDPPDTPAPLPALPK